MPAEPRAYLLDITRLVARGGRRPLTGIDRVERVYLETLMQRPEPLWLLLSTRFGHILLSGREVAGTVLAADTEPARLTEALRERAEATCGPLGLRRTVARLVGTDAVYFNVGHMNLSYATLSQLRGVKGLFMAMMLHDTIPLDWPDFSGPGATRRFARQLDAAARHADLLLCNSRATEADVRRWLHGKGHMPPTLIAPLGVATAPPDPAALPAGLLDGRPCFLALGTIEPRKNHALLLDVWEALAADRPAGSLPRLVVAGRRGWAGPALFRRLDALASGGAVVEANTLSDGAVSALMANATALLMPSFAEGFGLPVAEAAALGTPVVAGDLPVYRETVGDYPIYLTPDDRYAWQTTISALAAQGASEGRIRREADVPRWDTHFALVLGRTGRGEADRAFSRTKGPEWESGGHTA